MKKQIETIADIAQLAKVSKSTVSRALNDSPLLKEETKKRIRAIAEKHNFTMNYGAQLLSTQRSYTIALVIPTYKDKKGYNYNDPFFRELVAAIATPLSYYNYDLLYGHTKGDSDQLIRSYISSKRVDGLILIPCTYDARKLANTYYDKIPLIIWGTEQKTNKSRYNTVNVDNKQGGYLATQHLIDCGCKTIAFLGGNKHHSEMIRRFGGYKKALADNNIPLNPDLITYAYFSGSIASQVIQTLLKNIPTIDGIFVSTDVMAFGVIEGIQKCNKKVPDDISVVGFDDIPLAKHYNPPLTTVRQDIEKIGKNLVENLMENIDNSSITNTVLPVELIIRDSTKK